MSRGGIEMTTPRKKEVYDAPSIRESTRSIAPEQPPQVMVTLNSYVWVAMMSFFSFSSFESDLTGSSVFFVRYRIINSM